MGNQRATFAKRQREADLKDKARQKSERRAAKKSEVRTTKGPEIAWDQAVTETVSDGLPPLPGDSGPAADSDGEVAPDGPTPAGPSTDSND
jgi:hypothetical protein